MIEKIWYYLTKYKPPWPYRLPIMLIVGGCLPPLVHMYFGDRYGFLRATEITFILMIPVSAWLIHCRNSGWLDDDDEDR